MSLSEKREVRSKIRPATESPQNKELARRIDVLTQEGFDADCAKSIRPIIRAVVMWSVVAALVWVIMLVRET